MKNLIFFSFVLLITACGVKQVITTHPDPVVKAATSEELLYSRAVKNSNWWSKRYGISFYPTDLLVYTFRLERAGDTLKDGDYLDLESGEITPNPKTFTVEESHLFIYLKDSIAIYVGPPTYKFAQGSSEDSETAAWNRKFDDYRLDLRNSGRIFIGRLLGNKIVFESTYAHLAQQGKIYGRSVKRHRKSLKVPKSERVFFFDRNLLDITQVALPIVLEGMTNNDIEKRDTPELLDMNDVFSAEIVFHPDHRKWSYGRKVDTTYKYRKVSAISFSARHMYLATENYPTGNLKNDACTDDLCPGWSYKLFPNRVLYGGGLVVEKSGLD